MEPTERPSIRKNLDKLEEYMRTSSTREQAYRRFAEEFGVTVEAVRNAASQAGLTSWEHSMRCVFSEEEEEMLVCVCLIYARQGTPFTFSLFAELARKVAGRDEDHPFSRHFVSDFVARHPELVKDYGKITSPTRSPEMMFQMTEEFVDRFSRLVASKKANEKNIFVFDETIIGVSTSQPIVIGEAKPYSGRNINVVKVRESVLGSFIPFSMVDGSTPFRVFISSTKDFPKSEDAEFTVAPAWEKGLRESPRRLFLSSKTGYISTDLFACIMKEFTKWWTSTRPGLECFLISDNLSIHKNKDIVEEAEHKGIHMLNIMPGSSHWFQVHDQLPFAVLKKRMMIENSKCFSSFFVPREVSRTMLMCNFYKAEACALKPEIIIKSFADVGLWPLLPDRIMENCRKFCRVDSHSSESDEIEHLAEALKTTMGDELDKTSKMLREMKCVKVTSPKKGQERENPDKKAAKSTDDKNAVACTSTAAHVKPTAPQLPKKRGRPPKSDGKK